MSDPRSAEAMLQVPPRVSYPAVRSIVNDYEAEEISFGQFVERLRQLALNGAATPTEESVTGSRRRCGRCGEAGEVGGEETCQSIWCRAYRVGVEDERQRRERAIDPGTKQRIEVAREALADLHSIARGNDFANEHDLNRKFLAVDEALDELEGI